MKKSLSLLGALLLAGCSHTVTLTPQDGIGPIGRGDAPASMTYSGKMRVELAGKTYAGEWTLQSDGGGVGYGLGSSGGQVATASFIGLSSSGNGKAYLTEPGGSSIACVFTYNDMSGTGLGACRTPDGKLYDMTIR